MEKKIPIFKTINELIETRTYPVLFSILVISLLIRFLLLPERWINPDEGAHLYDAKFILDGKIPFIDYSSRMPIYVYMLAAFLKGFGVNYISGRLLPLFSNIGIGIIVFLIGKKLFNSNKIALLASAIYLFSPLSILWSVVVKTELPETLFVCSGMLLMLTYIKSEKENYHLLFFSGFFFALAYYVRESSIAIFMASVLFMIYFHRLHVIKIIKSSIIMFLGYFLVFFIIILYFSSFVSMPIILESKLNPLETIKDPINKLFTVPDKTTNDEKSNYTPQSLWQTIGEWILVLKLNSFLFFGAFIFFLSFILKNKINIMISKLQFAFLSLWISALTIFYLYYSIQTNFYNQYFGEFMPVMSLILAYVIVFLISEIETHNALKGYAVKISLITIMVLFISSLSLINFSFGSVWSPDTVDEVSQYIRSNSVKEDVVLSGAMIWTFESNTRPFMDQNHPLRFLREMNEDQKREIEINIETEKPKFIVLDGYTEKTYIRNINNISNIINGSYVLRKEVSGSYYPVKVFEVKN
ncbi:MAG: glycosyltransferase family 39 protein [Candidatus Methanoperedens sp.]|nr:glycosyltransferase family 39 protein [Candidatus Methanoperedens sp.]